MHTSILSMEVHEILFHFQKLPCFVIGLDTPTLTPLKIKHWVITRWPCYIQMFKSVLWIRCASFNNLILGSFVFLRYLLPGRQFSTYPMHSRPVLWHWWAGLTDRELYSRVLLWYLWGGTQSRRMQPGTVLSIWNPDRDSMRSWHF